MCSSIICKTVQRIAKWRSSTYVEIDDVATAFPMAAWSVHGRKRVRSTMGS